ncbi:MAG: hypothetical protein ACKVJ6_07910 [Flavobacteriales bacterium]|jgi:hypothetical protein|tara:strand:- start:1280 stop:1726 length:447 start_codon:yes stop_codon:yes gene_type:complete
MKNIFKLVVLSLVLSSCAVTNSHNFGDSLRSRSYVELNLDDIQYLGETEISYEYSRYLFVGTRVISINGELPDNSEKHYVELPTSVLGNIWSIFEPNMKRALYKAYLEYPNADYIEITTTNVKTYKMFLGRKIRKSANVKAYKYKYAK